MMGASQCPVVPRRRFGASDVELSALAFGPARLSRDRISRDEARDLLLLLYDHGVTSFHSSHEYEAHGFFCGALRDLRAARPAARLEHIVKLAEPHFDATAFDPSRFRARVEQQLTALDADRLDIVQWLVRHTPNDDGPRLAVLEQAADAMRKVWDRLNREGKVGVLAAHPYSEAFRVRVLEMAPVRGLVDYLNLSELDTVPHLDRLAAGGFGVAAIRPLFAGRLAPPGGRDAKLSALYARFGVEPAQQAAFAIGFPLLHPTVATVILGVSSARHGSDAVAAVAATAADRERFATIVAALH